MIRLLRNVLRITFRAFPGSAAWIRTEAGPMGRATQAGTGETAEAFANTAYRMVPDHSLGAIADRC